MTDSALEQLATAHGIALRWRDIAGVEHSVTPETQRALLAAMGLNATTEAEVGEALRAHRATELERRLPREIVARADARLAVSVSAPTEWQLHREDGDVVSGRAKDEIRLTPPAGIHRLTVGAETCLLIAAPPRAPDPQAVVGRPSVWGVTAPLYGLRSARNLGVGDYADLASVAEALGELGADFLGVNPVHARGAASDDISPYSPSSRIAYDTGFIAVDRVAGAEASDALRLASARNELALSAARAGDLVDYDLRAAITEPVLHEIFEATQAGSSRGDGPRGEPHDVPGPLEDFALFEALSLVYGKDWRCWPKTLQDPASPETRHFAAGHASAVEFHLWLQRLASKQIAAAHERAIEAGMALGLYLDVAVGVRPDGADVWAERTAFARGVSLGAPPDRFSPDGQNWNLAPFSPRGLRETRYKPLADMLRAAMTHAGAIRIDHVLGFRRAFWLPESGAPGAYLDYPLDALLAITRIEAARAGCVVVGEDLGSVPEGFRDRLAESGLLGCAVVQFERDADGFKPPSKYRRNSIASFGTHDTPTLRGWWEARDIELRAAIHEQSPAAKSEALARRKRDRAALAQMLVSEGCAAEGVEPADPPAEAAAGITASLHSVLAGAASALVAVQLDDALGALEQQNLPGTTDQHPNWRRKIDVAAESMKDDPRLADVAEIMNKSRGRNAQPAGREEIRCS